MEGVWDEVKFTIRNWSKWIGKKKFNINIISRLKHDENSM